MRYLLLLLVILVYSCNPAYKFRTHEFPDPVDTTDKPVEYQEKKTYELDGVFATNEFACARLNDFTQLGENSYRATISPENTPINNSPWYAFKLWSPENKKIDLELFYTHHNHRYRPKVSRDGKSWEYLDNSLCTFSADSVNMTMQLELSPDTLWVAAQEIQSHKDVGDWVKKLSMHPAVHEGDAGVSKQGRKLYLLDLYKGERKKKPAVVIISRQHPPEVTGYFAMIQFVEYILEAGEKNGFLDQYRVLVYPMLNPDGVDLGHHRHNTGGIDMNRDWGVYNQQENRAVVQHIVSEAKKYKNDVMLGLDFHSTQEDVYYTFDKSLKSKIPEFTSDWLERIRVALDIEDINEEAYPLNAPISKGWFIKQFNAESITYEIGDETPREFIKKKGQVSAKAMMDILMGN